MYVLSSDATGRRPNQWRPSLLLTFLYSEWVFQWLLWYLIECFFLYITFINPEGYVVYDWIAYICQHNRANVNHVHIASEKMIAKRGKNLPYFKGKSIYWAQNLACYKSTRKGSVGLRVQERLLATNVIGRFLHYGHIWRGITLIIPLTHWFYTADSVVFKWTQYIGSRHEFVMKFCL